MAFAFRHQAVALILIIGTKEKRGTKYKSITTLKKLLCKYRLPEQLMFALAPLC